MPAEAILSEEDSGVMPAEAILSEDSVILAAIRPGSPQTAEASEPQPPALRAPARQGGMKERGEWQPRGKGRQPRML